MEDYYKILKLNFGASSNEIKRQFRILAKKYHPDKNKGDKKSEELFKKILEAYQTLSDFQSKENYDIKYEKFKSSYNYTNSKGSNNEGYAKSNQTHSHENTKSKTYFSKRSIWFFILAIILLIVLINEKTTTTGNQKADTELQESKQQRPESGEIDF